MGEEISKKPVSSYSLLQKTMSEIEKSKKVTVAKSSVSSKANSNASSGTFSSKVQKKSSPREIELMLDKKENRKNPNVPDRTYGDFYCPICDSHMNSDAMWEAHITGKRHLKNVKKGDPDPKYEDLDVEPSIEYEIRNETRTVVGLSYIHEIRRKEAGAPPLYTCFLCQTTFATVKMVIEHVTNMKHRLNYIRENSPDDYHQLDATTVKKSQMETLVEGVASRLEEKFGRGSVKVKQEKIRQTSYYSSKRAFDSDDEDEPKKPKRRYEKSDPYVWKAVDCQKKGNFKEIKDCREIINIKRGYTYSSDEETDMHKKEHRTKRQVYDHHSSTYKSSMSRESRKDPVNVRTTYDSPEERSSHFRPHSRKSPKRELYHPRSPPYAPDSPHSRSYETQDPKSSKQQVAVEPKTKQSGDNSMEHGRITWKDFIQKLYGLPSETFFKLVLLKLDNIEVQGIKEMYSLSEVGHKIQTILHDKLPPGLLQNMSRNSENSIQTSSTIPTAQAAASNSYNNETSFIQTGSHSPRSDFNFVQDILNQSEGNNMSSYHNVTPHQTSYQTVTSHPNSIYGNISSSSYNNNIPSSNYPYNSAPSSTTSSIPGLTLTDENRDAQLYNMYQPLYSDPSSSYTGCRY